MKASLIFLFLIAGLGVWFWLLLRPVPAAAPVERIEVTKEESAPAEPAATSTEEVPSQTDAGMEFPTSD